MKPSSITSELFTARTVPDGQQCDAWADQPLLHSLEQGGIRWPSSCRTGACRTCIGRLQNGKVRYEQPPSTLSAKEQAKGYVLPCVAYPCSDVVLRQGD